MPQPKLRTCPFLGPFGTRKRHPARALPSDAEVQPFKYLPPAITLSKAELQLARQYESGDFSGGYLTSQIAYFRRGPTRERHQQRRRKFRPLKAEVHRLGFVLPDAYIELVETDQYMARLRHNSIWLQLPDELVSLPSHPEYKLFLIFGEGQGGGYWHLLLGPDGSSIVTYSEHPFGLRNVFVHGYQPDLASFKVFQCADSFSQWIVNYFAECIKQDRHYEKMLVNYPGM
jgi:hypothetical protein